MSKMLWELALPVEIACAKEDLSKNNIWKYLRYFNMYMARFGLKIKGADEETNEQFNYSYFSKIMFNSKIGIINDPVYGACVGRIDEVKTDPTGKITHVDFEFDNGKVRRNLKVNQDVIIAYADETRIPPVLYIWAIANKILTKEAIIDQQDNMLRKPIIVTGEGEEFDNAVNNANKVLSGIEWINTSGKKGKQGKSILDKDNLQVLNLQVGNAYKGTELWESRKQYEELMCDYMGYPTTKNEKQERMISAEVNNAQSIGKTFYKSSVACLENMKEKAKKILSLDIEIIKNLEEVKEDVNSENKMESNAKSGQQSDADN